MHKSGIVVALAVGRERNVRFCWTTPDILDEKSVDYQEEHRTEQSHHLYGLTKADKVLLIEDEITTGLGVIGLINKLREKGIETVGVATFIETVNFNGRNRILDATGLHLTSLTRIQLI